MAPPDRHLILTDGRIALSHGPTVHGLRPAIDPLFQSAARTYGARVLGVVLTGGGDDGTAGLRDVKGAGGLTVAQDPEEALHPSMPQNAIEFVPVNHVMRLADIALLIQAEAGGDRSAQPFEFSEGRVANLDADKQGRVSSLTCPECNGALWQRDEDGLLRFQCRIGHVYSPESLLEEQADTVDRALWAALRSLQERAALCRKLALQARVRGHAGSADTFLKRAEEMDGHAVVLRDVISRRMPSLETPDYAVEAPSPESEERPSTSR